MHQRLTPPAVYYRLPTAYRLPPTDFPKSPRDPRTPSAHANRLIFITWHPIDSDLIAKRSPRGEGNKCTGLGFDDYLYAPTSRQNILAVIGKYLGFEPIAASPLPQPADDHPLSQDPPSE